MYIFIKPLKQKMRGRGLVKWFITAKIIKKYFLQDEQDLTNALKTLLFVGISPYLYEWSNRNVINTIYKLYIRVTHHSFVLSCSLSEQWTQNEHKWNKKTTKLSDPHQKETQSTYWRSDVWCEQFLCFI